MSPAERITGSPPRWPSVRRPTARAGCRSCWPPRELRTICGICPAVAPTCGEPPRHARPVAQSPRSGRSAGRPPRRQGPPSPPADAKAGPAPPGGPRDSTRSATGSIRRRRRRAACGSERPAPPPRRGPCPGPNWPGHAREQGRVGHCLPRRRATPCSTASAIAGSAILRPCTGQGLRDRLGLARDVTLQELRDRVHAAGRRDGRRHAHRQLRVDQRDPRQDPLVAEALLERGS